ncbi:hypothetical protein, variant 1 [Aphanomyces invadans]|uniref:Uncharacterized protein n=1 Tax=Aphanomyces invadans TaxID=157072 RepID=A0A024U7M7_9STRA|nr:hypothetical protein, variant 1 [Aphanomyces invadans]ETW02396.1 hypothetical protein, variant 1 [Aphanomyces invadans]|eukprot:XP_008869001.1 hypothetical protein, variant 1 [Aphanomyces invadans]
MELETFLATQPWLALVHDVPDACDAMEQIDPTTMHGMFLVNDYSFCSFAPTHGDQTQFDFAFFLQRGSSSTTPVKRGMDGAVVKPAVSRLYVRILDKIYWIDHGHIERPPEVVASSPSVPVYTEFELGSVRFRFWMCPSLSRDEQHSRLSNVLSTLRQHLRLPCTPPPSLPTLHSRVVPDDSPYQVFQRLWEHDADCDSKLRAFAELCEAHGIDAHVLPRSLPRSAAIADIWQSKLLHGDLDTLIRAFGFGFSTACDIHDECFLLRASGTTTRPSQTTQCTTVLWELWERYLDANDLPASETSQPAGSAIDMRVHLLTSAMVCRNLREEWSRHATSVRSLLMASESRLLDEVFPPSLHPPRSDMDIQAACTQLHAVKQAKKKALRDELVVLLLPTALR